MSRKILGHAVKMASIQTVMEGIQTLVTKVPHPVAANIFDAAQRAAIPLSQIIRIVPLRDQQGVVLCILPAENMLDVRLVQEASRRELAPLSGEEMAFYFKDVDPSCLPALPNLYEAEIMLDVGLFNEPILYFQANDPSCLYQIKREDYQKIVGEVWQGTFSLLPAEFKEAAKKNVITLDHAIQQFLPKRLKTRVEETFDLPVLPPMANRILQMRVDPAADALHLSKLVEQDPSLAAQVLSWARSPYYGYSGHIESVEDAIIKVLGYDLVMNLALGIACGREISIVNEGPLGLAHYWRFALYTSALCDALSRVVPMVPRPKRGLAYLCGLLHNFGFLLMGQLFQPQFELVSQYAELNPHFPIYFLEQHALGIGHEQFGGWLFKAWHLPNEVVLAAQCHHHDVKDGEGSIYALLVQIAIRLLKREKLGDAENGPLPVELLARVGLSQEEADEALFSLLSQREALDLLVEELLPK